MMGTAPLTVAKFLQRASLLSVQRIYLRPAKSPRTDARIHTNDGSKFLTLYPKRLTVYAPEVRAKPPSPA